jgi:hypothetical protein
VAIIKIDFEGTGEEREWPVLEAGVYPAKIQKIVREKSKAGNWMLTWYFEVEGLPGTIRTWTSLVPTALFSLRTILRNLGYEVPEGEIEIDTDELTGQEVAVKLTKELHWDSAQAEKGVMVNNIADGGVYSRSVLETADNWS